MKQETTFQAVRRHLRNGYVILTSRGPVALYGAAMREAAKLVDSPVGVFLAPKDIFRDGPHFLREHGLRGTIGAVLRQTAATYDPPLGRRRNPVNDPLRERAINYYHTYELTKPDGVVPSRRPANEMDFALEIPFAFDAQPAHRGPIAAFVHAFYPEILPLVLEKLSNVPGPVDLYLSTDTQEKQRALTQACATWSKGKVEIRVTPNRGRDIAAKFFGFRDVYANYDIFVHLHTKRSPHGGDILARWRDYLMDHLLGSPDIVRAILTLFDDPRIGVVFPQHLFELRGILNWGYDYDLARRLLERMGVRIDKNLVLEFPSGSMFWGRSAAFRPLLDLDIGFDDFPTEGGHVDGTLAHAIERSLLMVAESAGFEWLKVARRDLYPMPQTLLSVNGLDDLPAHRLKVFQPCLGNVDNGLRPQDRGIVEIKPLLSYPSRNARPRLNLIVPTVNPQQIFGGVSTAIKLFGELADALDEDYDRRIIATDADVEPEAYANFPDYEAVPHAASLDLGRRILVDAYERDGSRLDLRANDIFIATAWWTALFAIDLETDRARLFGGALPFIYLIQDDEPYFQGRSSRYALAEATYRHGARTIAIVNSEELFSVMRGKYAFRESYCVPYELNASISGALQDVPRERLMLVYGRPNVARNAFELVCDGLFRWQQRDPIRASRWRIVFLGEEFPEALLYPVQNATVGGKASLEDYASYLSRASVGVSLMLSPHPSYPPLEMAEAGLLTITNDFDGKSLKDRFDNILPLEWLEPASIADAIEAAVAQAEPRAGEIVPRVRPKAPALDTAHRFDVVALAENLRGLRV
jgi:O-antigen biosynthesis protein